MGKAKIMREIKQKYPNMLTAEQFRSQFGKKKNLRSNNQFRNKEMTESFLRQCKEAKLPEPTCEYRFHVERKWKIDFYFAEEKIAVEIEGRGHNKHYNFQSDMEKYNEISKYGIFLFRFTVKQVFDGSAITYLKKLY